MPVARDIGPISKLSTCRRDCCPGLSEIGGVSLRGLIRRVQKGGLSRLISPALGIDPEYRSGLSGIRENVEVGQPGRPGVRLHKAIYAKDPFAAHLRGGDCEEPRWIPALVRDGHLDNREWLGGFQRRWVGECRLIRLESWPRLTSLEQGAIVSFHRRHLVLNHLLRLYRGRGRRNRGTDERLREGNKAKPRGRQDADPDKSR